MNITSVILKEKLRFIEISARKLHLSAVILGLKVQFFENKSIRFRYSFEYFNDYQGIEKFFTVWKHKVRCKNFLRDLKFKDGAILEIW